jgi:hypothetical protein
MMDSNEHRDDALGTELRGLDMPPERTDFFTDLQSELDAQRAQSKRAAKRRFLVPMAGTAVAASLVAAVLVVSAQQDNTGRGQMALPTTTVPTTNLPPEEKLNAMQVVARIEQSFAETKAIKGTLVQEFFAAPGLPGEGTRSAQTIELLYTADGSIRSRETDDHGGGVTHRYYDPKSRTQTEVRVEADRTTAVAYENRAIGWYAGNSLFQSASGYAQSFRDEANTNVVEVTFDGKEAWQLEKRSGTHVVRLVADKQTGFPLQLSGTENSQPVFVHTLRDLEVNPTVKASDFTPVIPRGVTVERSDSDMRRVTPVEASRLAGYSFVRPSYVPEGFALEGVWYQPQATSMGGDGREVVTALYRRGMATIEFVTSTRWSGEPSNRYLPWEGDVGWESVSQATLSGGIYSGKTVTVEDDLLSSPTIYGDGNKVSFGLHGGVSHDELLKMANSLTAE